MITVSGKSANTGISIGNITVFKKADDMVRRKIVDDVDEEIKRLESAVVKAKKQIRQLYDKALIEVGNENAAIFQVQQMMLDDDDYMSTILNMIRAEKVNAEYAVAVTGNKFAKMFSDLDDDYMKARSTDIKDISHRLIQNLGGTDEISHEIQDPTILIADELTPSELMQINRDKILAIVTVNGSINSHTAILARMMNIPALVGVKVNLDDIRSGMKAIVDGDCGTVIIDPEDEQCKEAQQRLLEEKSRMQLLEEMKGKESVTLYGKKVRVYANIGSISDVEHAIKNDAEGIGLFRSEFIYLEKNKFPTEEEQFQVYKKVLQMMKGKKVIIRTLDIGSDKQADYFNTGREDNPALGYRAIRICLNQPDIFKVQLRALLRASVYGNLSIMYPMIISVEEVKKIYKIVEEVKNELDRDGISYVMPEQGIMIETPAAVMISDELAEIVDFFSIGTNDLTQYTLAIDRQNEKLADYYNPYHKAIMKMIRMVTENAHKHGKWVGICGELGADLSLTHELISLGIDEFSVPPSMVLKIRKKIREMA